MTVFYEQIRLVNCDATLRGEEQSSAVEETEEPVDVTTRCISDKCQPPSGGQITWFYGFERAAAICCRKNSLTHGSTAYAGRCEWK